MTLHLSGALPPGNRNGIDAIADAMMHAPGQSQIILARVSCKQITTKAKGNTVVVTAGIDDLEAFTHGSTGWTAANELLERQREYRTGQAILPLDA